MMKGMLDLKGAEAPVCFKPDKSLLMVAFILRRIHLSVRRYIRWSASMFALDEFTTPPCTLWYRNFAPSSRLAAVILVLD